MTLPVMLSTRSGVEPIDPSMIPTLLPIYVQSTYVQIAIATILCYDTIVTFDKEVEYFWSSPRKTVSIVYFLNRYMGIVSALVYIPPYSDHTHLTLCNFSAWAGSLGGWMTIVLIDYILLMRVLALWSGERKLAIYLRALFAIESTFMLGFLVSIVIKEKVSVVGAEGYIFCNDDGTIPPLFEMFYWMAALIFELILMVLALYKAASLWRESAGFKGVGLVKVLILDQAFYFSIIMICGVAHVAFNWVDQEASLNAALNIMQVVLMSVTFPCIVGCRLLVHLNEAAEMDVNGGTSYRPGAPSRIVSDMQFT